MSIDYPSIRDSALDDLRKYMNSLDPDKGKKLAYWVQDYVRFLKQESTFLPSKLIRYKRGAIVKVHLGYRVGSEEGGLHYAIVHSPTLTVIPLTSVKPGVDISNLPRHKVSIGEEVHTLLTANLNAEIRTAKQQLKELESFLEDKDESSMTPEQRRIFTDKALDLASRIDYCRKMKREVDKMKTGSIALVGQITTVSKIRIYDPKYNKDALSKVRVSNSTLDILDARVQELYGAISDRTVKE